MAVLGGQSVDRPPISMWRHFYSNETSAQGLADAMLSFQHEFDWDFMKINPRASYHGEVWGLRVEYNGNGPPRNVSWPIQIPTDWRTLEVVSPQEGILGEQLHALEIIASGLNGKVPFLMTIFSPLSIAARLVPSEDLFLMYLREYPEEVNRALKVITQTFAGFSRACLELGASGIFFATTSWATSQRLSWQEYLSYAKQYDLDLLDAVSSAEFNLLHVCKDYNFLKELQDYPTHAFNWDTHGAGNLSLAEGKAFFNGRPVIGGIPHQAGLLEAKPSQLEKMVADTIKTMGDQGWMLGTGCTFDPTTQQRSIHAIRQAVDKI